ncbi:MAG TPA: Uma2 family endonuclease [Polyangiaceae bacterium]|nr:Uma2 family endonuclease [Polyangiaceae bacterium]
MQAIVAVNMLAQSSLSLRYPVRPRPEAWVIPEGTVPESTAHDAAVLHIYLLLRAWATRQPGRVRIARNLAVRWFKEHPKSGIDPDLCVLDPAPEEMDRDLGSLCLWKPGHEIPRFCVEVVSTTHPNKDYVDVPERYAALGVPELLIFDPLLQGPKRLGGPVPLQLWRRDATGTFERVHFGSEPVHSSELDAWVSARGTELVISRDRGGAEPWLTETELLREENEQAHAEKERERTEKERERAEKEQERAARLELERRLAELEAKLGK